MSKHTRNLWIAVLFWTAIWAVLGICLNDVLFAGPLETLRALARLAVTMDFWKSILTTLCKIAIGFGSAFLAGILLAVLCRFCPPLRILLAPAIAIMKSVPVACFVAVALIWMRSTNISILVTFFVVFPITFAGLDEGLRQVDPALIEMAQVFRMSQRSRLKFVYLPQVMPYVLSGCRVSVGMAWKSGIAGEIIGLPDFSIGEQLYLSKLYLEIGDLFAWTVVIILISLFCERAIVHGLLVLQRRWEAGYGDAIS